MRVGFVTCVELGMACIDKVLDIGGRFDLLVTIPDSAARAKSGRVFLDDLANKHGMRLVKVRNINDVDAVDQIRGAELDILFIIGWSQIAGPEVLRLPRLGVVGMHPTLLPVGRGRASVPWAILKDLPTTGVTVFKLDPGVDTGPVIAQQTVHIRENETATTLYAKVTQAHVELMEKVWRMLAEDHLPLIPQEESNASTWPARNPSDGEIHADTMTVREVDRLVRATTHPYPGAFYVMSRSQVLRVWAGTGDAARSEDVVAISVVDGEYYATNYAFEDTGSPE